MTETTALTIPSQLDRAHTALAQASSDFERITIRDQTNPENDTGGGSHGGGIKNETELEDMMPKFRVTTSGGEFTVECESYDQPRRSFGSDRDGPNITFYDTKVSG